MKIQLLLIVVLLSCLMMACDNTIRCEKHFIPNGYLGRVMIYFNQKNGQKQFDKDGCIVYEISKQGKCFSALPFKEGTAYPNKTFNFFEVINKDSTSQIFEFYKEEYLKDTIRNRQKKYVFFLISGYSNGNYCFDYDVDYGMNYKNHLYN